MKEIQKVVQKLSPEQESAAGGAGGGGGVTNRYKNIKSPPVYWGDLITYMTISSANAIIWIEQDPIGSNQHQAIYLRKCWPR